MILIMTSIKEDPIAEILKKIAPGTPIREGLDNILKAKTGADIFLKTVYDNGIQKMYLKDIL